MVWTVKALCTICQAGINRVCYMCLNCYAFLAVLFSTIINFCDPFLDLGLHSRILLKLIQVL